MTDQSLFINRELSWLEFNARVLHESTDERNPLLERLKFLAIFSTNLDEFYMVRVAGLRRQIATGLYKLPPDGTTPLDEQAAINKRVAELLAVQSKCLYGDLLPAMAKKGIKLLGMDDLSKEEWQTLDAFFEAQVFPVLTPLVIDPGHPFPYISNLSLSLAVQIYDPVGKTERFARVKVPKSLPRWIPVGRAFHFVPLEQLIGANLGALFPGMEIRGFKCFRITRYSDLEVDHSEEEGDLLSMIEEQIFQRRFAEIVRIEVEPGISPTLRGLLLEELREDQPPEMPTLSENELVETGPLLDLGDLLSLAALDVPELRDPTHVPVTPSELRDPARSIFDVIREGDILLHHPFDSFSSSIEQFLKAATFDENVLAIKMTLYRTSGDTAIVRALTEAAQRGKQVAVLVELQARFDEANNITWARTLESFGVHVAYGLPGLKTHTKTTLVVRREADGIRRYAHVGSGNYNSKTARVYTDIGLLTCSPSICADLTDLFNALTGFSRQKLYRKLLIAPANMRIRFLEMIVREAHLAREGKPGRIIAKMNALVDQEVINALYSASQAGVEIDLIVRGICCLRPGVPEVSERIRVISIVGRFLEHSRIFYFGNGGEAEYYFGSADWMPRNFDRRVEAVAPVESERLRERVHSLLEACLADRRQTWELGADGSYTKRESESDDLGLHELLMRDSWALSRAAIPPAPELGSPEAARDQSAASPASS
jgi:polyphosphate kinase